MPFIAAAQTEESKDPQWLQGKWTIEQVLMYEVKDNTPVSMDDVNMEIYPEMEIKQDSILLFHKRDRLRGTYRVDETFLQVDFIPIPFKAEWKVVENQLHLLHVIEKESEDPETIHVSFIYRRK